jgi:hypothetical protein
MTLPDEVSHRVAGDELRAPQNTFEISGGQADYQSFPERRAACASL